MQEIALIQIEGFFMPKQDQYKNTNGIVLMLINSFATSMLYVIAKYLTEFISSNQVVFIYKSLVLIGILPWILYDGIACIRTKKLKLHLLRGLVSTLGALFFFYGMSKVDIASATALNKMEPVLLMIISAIFFKEKLSNAKISTAALSCLGMLFVVFPFITLTDTGINFSFLDNNIISQGFNYNYLIVLLGVALWTANSSVIKILGRTESNRTQLFYVSLVSVLVSMPTAIFQWNYQSFGDMNILWINGMNSFANINSQTVGFLLCLGMLHFTHVACYFQSLKIAEMSAVAPFDYSRLVFGGLLGYCFFGNTPTISAYVGYALIIISGVYLLKIEAKDRQKRLSK